MENASTPAVTPAAVGIRYGLIAGVAMAILSFIQLAFISDPETPFRWLSALVAIGAIFLAHKGFKQLNRGFMSYGQGLGIGTILSLVAGAVSSVFSYIYINFIDPDYMVRVMDITRTRMEEKGMDDAQIDQAMVWAEKFSSGPITIVFGLLISVFMGLIVSLIISAFTKNARPEFE